MELFYHVSRDIELPRTGRRLTVPAGPRACEACGAQLEGGEPSEGGTFGLAFCAGCRDRLDRSAIQIHFCDGCGVSVPLYAVEEGTALVGDGRILCLRCRSPARRSSLALMLGVAVVCGIVLGAALALYL
jgi:hypothetical protein